MARKSRVVRIISEATADRLMADLGKMPLEKVGRKHGIQNAGTIPLLVSRAYERAGRRVPASLRRMKGQPGQDTVVTVGKRGTIILPKEAVVDGFGYKKGRKFIARRHGKKIILTAVGRTGRRKTS